MERIAIYRRLFITVIAAFASLFGGGESVGAAPPAECVVLLHGLGRTHRSMKALASFLEERGFHPFNIDYPSTSETIESITAIHVTAAVARCSAAGCGKIHFVTHSMGGIALRLYLQEHSLPEGSRVVMLSPPNQGSEVVDHLKGNAFFRWLLGPAAQQLGTDALSVPHRLEPVPVQVGVITGNRSLEPWFSGMVEGPDDGKVSVERAKLKEMKDFIVLPVGHTFIMNDDEVMRQTVFFLRHGRFDRDDFQR